MHKIAPGQKDWISTTDLIWLHHLPGHPRSLASLDLTSRAAQARVRVWDAACADHEPDPGTPLEWCEKPQSRLRTPHTHSHLRLPNNLTSSSTFRRRANYLHKLISAPDEPYTRVIWRRWFEHSMVLTLDTNLERVQLEIGPVNALMTRRPRTNDQQPHQHWKQIWRKFQSFDIRGTPQT